MNVRNGLFVDLDFNYIFLLTVIFLFFIRVLIRLKHDMVEEIKVLDNGRSSGRENEFFNWNINDFISFNRLRIFFILSKILDCMININSYLIPNLIVDRNKVILILLFNCYLAL